MHKASDHCAVRPQIVLKTVNFNHSADVVMRAHVFCGALSSRPGAMHMALDANPTEWRCSVSDEWTRSDPVSKRLRCRPIYRPIVGPIIRLQTHTSFTHGICNMCVSRNQG